MAAQLSCTYEREPPLHTEASEQPDSPAQHGGLLCMGATASLLSKAVLPGGDGQLCRKNTPAPCPHGPAGVLPVAGAKKEEGTMTHQGPQSSKWVLLGGRLQHGS